MKTFCYLLILVLSSNSLAFKVSSYSKSFNFFNKDPIPKEILSESLDKLDQYTQANNITFKFEVKNSRNKGLGLFTKSNIQIGDTVISIPSKLTLSLLNPKIKNFCNKSLGTSVDLLDIDTQKICLVLFFYYDCANKESQFKYLYPLMKSIDFTSFPSYYTEKELSLLSNSILLQRINELQEETKILHSRLKPNISYKDFKDILTYLLSHAVLVKYKGTFVLINIHLSLFFNEKTENEKSPLDHNYDEENDMFYVEANKSFNKGDEVYLPYSDDFSRSLSVSDLLMETGFTNEDMNIIGIKNILAEDTKGRPISYFSIKKTKDFSIKNYPFDLIYNYYYYTLGMTKEANHLTIKTLVDTFRKYLSNYPTTIDQDMESLKKAVTRNEINILRVLIEEKRSLNFYLSYLLSSDYLTTK